MLEQFYVRDAKSPRNSPFTFKEDGFYRTLKKAVREEMKKIPKDTSNYSDMLIDGMLITLLASSALSCWVSNYWLGMLFYVVASVSLCMMIVAAHNYIHRKSNWRMYLFNFSLWSYR